MKSPLQFLAFFALLIFACVSRCKAQPQASAAPQPLNASVSDFGTSFTFSPAPICPKCVETELGLQSVGDGRYMPAVVSIAPIGRNLDFSVLVNVLDSELFGNDRNTQFGNRFDFVVRRQVVTKGDFLLTLAPRGASFARGGDRGRAGATAVPQYSRGNNLVEANFTWTAGIGISPDNPRSDYQGLANYVRTLDQRGTAVFLGFAHEDSGGLQTVGIEEGVNLPFRNGQVEFESAQLNLNTDPQWEFQTSVVVNWGKVFARK